LRVSTRQGSRHFPARCTRRTSRSPSSVAVAGVLSHFVATLRRDYGECWVVVRVETIVLHLDTTSLLGGLLLLAPAPEEDSSDYEKSYHHDGNNDSNCCSASGAESLVAAIAAA